MTNDRAGGFLREFHCLLRGGATAGLTDRELLERFVSRRDDAAKAAFEALVERHGPMVLGVCHRVLRDPSDASDAFQATFLVLVRKAGSVRVGDSLGPWLYGVSVRVAQRARTVAARRRGLEQTDARLADAPARDDRRGIEIRAMIDDELRGLPARYRTAIVLCYLEGLTHEEAADRLSCPVGTVRSRLARGRDLLRSKLTRRGLAPSVSVLAAILSPRPSRAALLPDELFTSTARAAARLAAGRTLDGVVPAGVSALVAGVSRIMTLTKLGTAAALISATLLIAAGAVALAGQRPQPTPTDAPPRPKPAPAIAQKPADPPAAKEVKEVEQPKDLAGAPTNDELFESFPPIVLNTVPATGATDVDPMLTEIRVTFSKEMHDGSWSWVTLNKEMFPEVTGGKIHYEKGKRTCVLPVKLVPGKNYALSINSQRFANFRDTEDNRAVPYMLLFRTRK